MPLLELEVVGRLGPLKQSKQCFKSAIEFTFFRVQNFKKKLASTCWKSSTPIKSSTSFTFNFQGLKVRSYLPWFSEFSAGKSSHFNKNTNYQESHARVNCFSKHKCNRKHKLFAWKKIGRNLLKINQLVLLSTFRGTGESHIHHCSANFHGSSHFNRNPCDQEYSGERYPDAYFAKGLNWLHRERKYQLQLIC